MNTTRNYEYSLEIIEPKLFSSAVADEIVASVNEAISERGRATIALSGGSTPGAIYRLLAMPPRVDEIDWSKVALYWGDERWVSQDDNQSNYRMVQETLLSQLGERQPKVYPVDTSLDSPEATAAAYESLIRETEKCKAGAMPEFDLMLLGMGEDGHTASIFPDSPVFESETGICFAAKHPTDGTMRISLSPQAVMAARQILFIVKGESKAEMVERVLRGNEGEKALPSSIYRRAESRVSWFLDSGAALRVESARG